MDWTGWLVDSQVLSRSVEGLIVLVGLWLVARAIKGDDGPGSGCAA